MEDSSQMLDFTLCRCTLNQSTEYYAHFVISIIYK